MFVPFLWNGYVLSLEKYHLKITVIITIIIVITTIMFQHYITHFVIASILITRRTDLTDCLGNTIHPHLLSHLFSKRSVLITMIWTTIGLSLTYALLLRYLKNLSYPKFFPTSTLIIFTILVNQHIVQVTALKLLFWKLFMICSFLLTKATYLY